jgi:soluble lytic murein transglycosylase-like protein
MHVTNVMARRKEGNFMICHEENCPRGKLARTSMAWAFAMSLGLLVCIADIKLPAETQKRDTPLKRLSVDDATFPETVLVDSDEPDKLDLSDSTFVPTEEPQLVPFDRIIHEAAGRHHVDADLILAVIMAESQFNPTARSKKGAKGLMQLMPVTADALDVADIYSPEENVNAGVRHLKWLLDRFDGNLRMALAAYNAGVQNVLRHDGVPPFPETQAYVKRVMEYYAGIKYDLLEF